MKKKQRAHKHIQKPRLCVQNARIFLCSLFYNSLVCSSMVGGKPFLKFELVKWHLESWSSVLLSFSYVCTLFSLDSFIQFDCAWLRCYFFSLCLSVWLAQIPAAFLQNKLCNPNNNNRSNVKKRINKPKRTRRCRCRSSCRRRRRHSTFSGMYWIRSPACIWVLLIARERRRMEWKICIQTTEWKV